MKRVSRSHGGRRLGQGAAFAMLFGATVVMMATASAPSPIYPAVPGAMGPVGHDADGGLPGVVEADCVRLAELATRLRDGRLQPFGGAVRPLAEAPTAFAPVKAIIRITED